jgi:proteasome accessory factor A
VEHRIVGIETEYGVTCTSSGQRRLTPDEVSRYLFRRVVSWGRSSNVFLGNGARLYLDVGSHPEYATAECSTLREALAQDRAGERIIEGLVEDAQARVTDEEIDGTVYAFKNNTDSAGNSYGCHENYLIGRSGDFSAVAEVFLPFLISRQITCGAGKLVVGPSGSAHYAVSQRADHIWEGVSSATTRSRPIINTRDEPHSDAERYRRLHVIVGDSNMSETTTLLKVGSAHLVLRLLEAGVGIPDLTLENPIRAIREISKDPTGRTLVRLANGKKATALDIQGAYFERAAAHVDRDGADDPLVPQVLELWGRTLEAVATGNLAAVETEIDWVIKRRLIERYQVKHGIALSDPAPGAVLRPAPARAGRPGDRRPGDLRGEVDPAADDPGQAARRLRPGRLGEPPGLHRRLGAPEAQRPLAADRAVQGPLRRGRRAGGAAHRLDGRWVSAADPMTMPAPTTCGQDSRSPRTTTPSSTATMGMR